MILGDCSMVLPELASAGERVDCIVTSPPFWPLSMQKLGLGNDKTCAHYLENLVCALSALRDVLSDEGSLWVVLGESDLGRADYGIPWRFACMMQDAGWFVQPESIWFREPHAYDLVLHFTKAADYWYTKRIEREFFALPAAPVPGYDFGTMPMQLIAELIHATCPELGMVLDPFAGSGTTGLVVQSMTQQFIGIEIDPVAYEIACKRLGIEAGVPA